MKRVLVFSLAIAAVVVLAAAGFGTLRAFGADGTADPGAAAGAGGRAGAGSSLGAPVFEAELTGVQEVPSVRTNTVGRARVEFKEGLQRAFFEIDVEAGKRITQAHIHCGPRGENGPIVVFLAGFHERGWDLHGDWLDDTSFTNENIVDASCGSTLSDLAAAMRARRMYVNVHSID